MLVKQTQPGRTKFDEKNRGPYTIVSINNPASVKLYSDKEDRTFSVNHDRCIKYNLRDQMTNEEDQEESDSEAIIVFGNVDGISNSGRITISDVDANRRVQQPRQDSGRDRCDRREVERQRYEPYSLRPRRRLINYKE